MVKPRRDADRFLFIGIDPGNSGGIVTLTTSSRNVLLDVRIDKAPPTENDCFNYLRERKEEGNCFAHIERIDPRPTRWFRDGQWQSSILKSTCLLYANYHSWRAFLLATNIPFTAVGPTDWLKHYGLKKDKGETDTVWKNRLKARAQELHPEERIILATSDAVLIAEHCRRTMMAIGKAMQP